MTSDHIAFLNYYHIITVTGKSFHNLGPTMEKALMLVWTLVLLGT